MNKGRGSSDSSARPRGEHSPWRVLVVEDDPLVSDVCRKFFESREEFEVAGVVRSGEDALQFLRRWPCHLLLLDLKLAGVSGVKVLQRLRAENVPVEVIAVTATRKAAVVRTVIQAGAISYLVKPFDIERLHQALDLFLTRMSALEGDDLDQGAIDDACASNGLARRHPKGLTVEGLARIRDVLRGEAEPIDSAAIGSRVGMSRVTARRYLEYLVRTNQAACHSEPSGRGRPRKLYTAVELTQGAPSAA